MLVDYNQNAWGRTLASVYSVRPRPRAPVVGAGRRGAEVERGFRIEDFRMDNMAARMRSPRRSVQARCWRGPAASASSGLL